MLAVFQPAEELARGAQDMVDDGLFDRFPKPDIVLAQHVGPLPAGMIGHRSGPIESAMDAANVVLHGRGGHGARPEATVDPVLMAANVVTRLQGIVPREVAPSETAVVTVGRLQAGSKTPRWSGPSAPRCWSATRTVAAFTDAFGPQRLLPLPQLAASEDVGALGAAAGVPTVYWFWGGLDTDSTLAALRDGRIDTLPSNHSPDFAPVIEPTLSTGIQALVVAARA